MQSLWNEAIAGVNTYVAGLKGKTKVYIAAFDSGSYDVLRDTTKKEYTPIGANEVSPRGTTPLYDSTAKLISHAEIANDEKTVLVIMTDGFENASQEFRGKEGQSAIKAKLATIEKRGWATVFLGANFDQVEGISAGLGVSTANTANFAKGNIMRGMESLSAKTMLYASAAVGSMDAMTAMNYTSEEKADLSTEKK